MKTFFNFYGGKYRIAPRYPTPEKKTIIEPFAGAAGYSLRYPDRNIILVDADEKIVGVWEYLIHVSAAEIMKLPHKINHINEVKSCQESRWLIGFWLNPGSQMPKNVPSAWARNPLPGRLNTYWGKGVRERIASQVDKIRHWKIIHGDYTESPNISATWFIDPPYNNDKGRAYIKQVGDYEKLGTWCKTRKGQVLVCENKGANWLPFKFLMTAKASVGYGRRAYSEEVLWTNG